MRSPQDNLYACLFKWAHRQDENFTTEAFAHLLRSLLDREAEAGVFLLEFLTDNRLAVPAADASAVEVTTQVTTETGRPDMEIGAGDHLVYVEAKDGAGLGQDQVGRYLKALARSGRTHTTLVLLTRYPLEKSGGHTANVERRWYEVAAFLDADLFRDKLRGTETRFLAAEFVNYLQIRGMAMDHVGWELKNGVRSAMSLVEMVYEGLKKRAPKTKYSIGQEWAGCYTDDTAKAKAWVGITWASPTELLFHSSGTPVTKEQAESAGFGVFNEGRQRWQHTIDLDSEEEHFFARSKANQQRRVEQFVDQCLDALENIRSKASSKSPTP